MSKDLTQKLNGSLEDKVDWLVAAVKKMDERQQSMDERQQSMDERLASLEAKVDKRLKDTTPMWEVVQAQLTELKESQDRLKESQDRLEQSQDEMRKEMRAGFRRLNRLFDHVAGDLAGLRSDYGDLEERVDALDRQLNP